MQRLKFDEADLDLFRDASHDASPLHMSASFARRTPFAQRVVHGVLNLLAAVAVVPRRGRLSTVDVEFFAAAVTDVDYQVRLDLDGEATVVAVWDGRRPILEAILRFAPETVGEKWPEDAVAPPRLTAARRAIADLHVGYEEKGRWSPSWENVDRLLERLRIGRDQVRSQQIATLLFVSYFVGMSIPGESAVLTRFSITFGAGAEFDGVLDYRVRIEEIPTSDEVVLGIDLGPIASGKVSAFFRSEVPFPSNSELIQLGGQSDALRGKVALVTGGSRGLGAVVARMLALQGCRVLINFMHSASDAERVGSAIREAGGHAQLLQGDIASADWCRDAAGSLERLDVLVCNASPSIQPLFAEPSAASRVRDFVAESFAMVSVPAATFAPLLAKSRGWNVLISSSYVIDSPSYFAHYVAAKSASEAYVKMMGGQYRGLATLIVRPPKLLTEQTNTPSGRKGTLRPEIVAARIAARLASDQPTGALEIMDDFGAAKGARG